MTWMKRFVRNVFLPLVSIFSNFFVPDCHCQDGILTSRTDFLWRPSCEELARLEQNVNKLSWSVNLVLINCHLHHINPELNQVCLMCRYTLLIWVNTDVSIVIQYWSYFNCLTIVNCICYQWQHYCQIFHGLLEKLCIFLDQNSGMHK